MKTAAEKSPAQPSLPFASFVCFVLLARRHTSRDSVYNIYNANAFLDPA
jgi:hypothetical protein